MKTRKALAILAACIGFVAALDDPAHSADGLYAKVGAWEVRGNSENGTCYTFANYPNDTAITIFVTRNFNASLMVQGVNSSKGQQHIVDMASSDGNGGTLSGYGVGNSAVLFQNINLPTVKSLANARQLFISGLGRYNLVKSKAALLKTLECVQALSGEAV